MADAVTLDSLLSDHKLLAPDGPVCLIVQATMGIAAGLDRFQPAGFPEIGHVIYDAPRTDEDGKPFAVKVCIVDSLASMANHLEQVCLPGENDPSLHADLDGLPYVKCVTDREPIIAGKDVTLKPDDPRDRLVATTLTEGHRLASDFFLDGRRMGVGRKPTESTFRQELQPEFGLIPVVSKEPKPAAGVRKQPTKKKEGKKKEVLFFPPESWWTIYKKLFEYDPNSLVHGVLFAQEQIKISRLLTAHLEAFDAARVPRSGVKFDRLGKTTSGQPIFSVEDMKAREIKATFIIDLAMLRSYGRKQGQGDATKELGLSPDQKKLLLALSLWKVRELLRRTFSYRSGCKLRMQSVALRTDDQADSDAPLATALPEVVGMADLIKAAYPADGDRVNTVYYPYKDLFRADKKRKKDRPDLSDEDDDQSDDGE